MINKLCEILEGAPRDEVDCELLGGYPLAEYLYMKGVRYMPTAYWIHKEGQNYCCSNCLNRSNDSSPFFCPHCGAQIFAEVTCDLKKGLEMAGVPVYISLKIPPLGVVYKRKRTKNQKYKKTSNKVSI